MDVKEKITAALQDAFAPEGLVLEDEDGITGYVTSIKFRGHDSLQRQKMIDRVLRAPQSNLTKAELQQVLVIAALTPEEYTLHVGD